MRACLTLAAAGCVLAAAAAPQPRTSVAPPAKLAQLLTKHFQFSASDLAAVGRGTVVVRSLPVSESREVVVAGAFWCDVPLDYFLTRARDIVTFKRVKEVQQIGLLGNPAGAANLAGLTIDQPDIDLLRKCVPGDCKFRLDRAGLERMRRDVPWSAPDATTRAQQLTRELVTGYVTGYQRSGNSALVEYGDQKTGVKVAKGLEALLNRSLWLHEAAPGLRQYADSFPNDPLPNVDNFMYWSKEAFGMKPVVAATHTIVWRRPGGTGDATILAKQIYASHYLDASVSLTVLMQDGRPAPGGVFVVYQNRSLVDLLQGGFLGPLRRSIARSRTKDGLAGQLEGLKKRLESEYRSTGSKEPGSTGGEGRRSTGGRKP